MKNRLILFFLALTMLMSLTACGENGLSLRPGGSGSPEDDVDVVTPDEEGVAVGYEGDTLRTKFFDMKVENPKTSTEFDGLTPEEGYKFLAVDLTLYNYTSSSVPMYDTDFEVVWDLDDDDAWAWPECDEIMDENGEEQYTVRSEQQIPVEFSLGIHKMVTGVLLYQVPEDSTDFIIDFYEIFEPETEGGDPEYGDAFYVMFSA